ncbi:hypothetical protein LUW77_06040 [Streptomyces radiopugnans]|nr:hypothetical protein LUW77_06040 [Streptomyces radiopugnans]
MVLRENALAEARAHRDAALAVLARTGHLLGWSMARSVVMEGGVQARYAYERLVSSAPRRTPGPAPPAAGAGAGSGRGTGTGARVRARARRGTGRVRIRPRCGIRDGTRSGAR